VASWRRNEALMSRYSILILLVCVCLLCLGHGLNGSLVGIQARAAQFSAGTTGLIMSGYSAGLVISAWLTPRLVRNVGHVRTFAGLASVVSSVVLMLPLWINPYFWFAMRLAAGVCTSGLFIVCEGWLNAVASNRNRGRLLSIYMIVTYGSLGAGQLLLNVADTSGFSRFIIVSSLLSLALVPLILLPTQAPSIEGMKRVDIADIWKASPLAVFGAFANGLGQSAFFAMGTIFGLSKGLSLADVSMMMALPPIGVIVSQYPVGLASDRFDRRTIILAMSAIAAAIAFMTQFTGRFSPWELIIMVTLFGTVSLPIYSMVIAHANDHIRKDQVMGASAKLILIYGIGSIMGPILVGQIMQRQGGVGFLYYMMAIYGTLALFTLWRVLRRPETLKGRGAEVMTVSPVTTPSVASTLGDR